MYMATTCIELELFHKKALTFIFMHIRGKKLNEGLNVHCIAKIHDFLCVRQLLAVDVFAFMECVFWQTRQIKRYRTGIRAGMSHLAVASSS